MKFQLSALVLAFLSLLHGMPGNADTNCGEFLQPGSGRHLHARKHYHPDPRSFKREALPVAIGPHSWIALYPELQTDLKILQMMFPRSSEYYRLYVKRTGHPPTLKEAAEYVWRQRELMNNTLSAVIEKHQAQNRSEIVALLKGALKGIQISAKSRQKFLARLEEYSSDYALDFDLKNKAHQDVFSNLASQTQGELGELEYALKLDYVVQKKLVFSRARPGESETNDWVTHIFEVLRSEVKKDPALMDRLQKEFPLLFNRFSIRENERIRSDLERTPLDDAEEWIRSKELDLVLQDPVTGKKTWVEIKNLNYPIDRGVLMDESEGKSYYTQLQETVQLRDFLGLRSEVNILAAYRNGLTQEVRDILLKMGIQTIGTIVD